MDSRKCQITEVTQSSAEGPVVVELEDEQMQNLPQGSLPGSQQHQAGQDQSQRLLAVKVKIEEYIAALENSPERNLLKLSDSLLKCMVTLEKFDILMRSPRATGGRKVNPTSKNRKKNKKRRIRDQTRHRPIKTIDASQKIKRKNLEDEWKKLNRKCQETTPIEKQKELANLLNRIESFMGRVVELGDIITCEKNPCSKGRACNKIFLNVYMQQDIRLDIIAEILKAVNEWESLYTAGTAVSRERESEREIDAVDSGKCQVAKITRSVPVVDVRLQPPNISPYDQPTSSKQCQNKPRYGRFSMKGINDVQDVNVQAVRLPQGNKAQKRKCQKLALSKISRAVNLNDYDVKEVPQKKGKGIPEHPDKTRHGCVKLNEVKSTAEEDDALQLWHFADENGPSRPMTPAALNVVENEAERSTVDYVARLPSEEYNQPFVDVCLAVEIIPVDEGSVH